MCAGAADVISGTSFFFLPVRQTNFPPRRTPFFPSLLPSQCRYDEDYSAMHHHITAAAAVVCMTRTKAFKIARRTLDCRFLLLQVKYHRDVYIVFLPLPLFYCSSSLALRLGRIVTGVRTEENYIQGVVSSNRRKKTLQGHTVRRTSWCQMESVRVLRHILLFCNRKEYVMARTGLPFEG